MSNWTWIILIWMLVVFLIGIEIGMDMCKHYLMKDIRFLQDRLNNSPKPQENSPRGE